MRSLPLVVAAAVLLAGCTADPPSPSASPSAGSPSAPASSGSASASPSPTGLPRPPAKSGRPRLRLVARFDSPVHVAAPPEDPRLFVVEQAGRVRVVKAGRTLATPFLDITSVVRHGGEQGLLSIAFPPDYADSGLFYVHHNGTDGAVRVAEYRVSRDPDRADPRSRRELLRIPKKSSNHNGGQLAFDPEGMLLVAVGDGGGGNDPDDNAQDLGTLLGKVLRIDPRPSGGRPYGIPPGNPYVDTSGARPEVWAYGLRNPWRFSLDPETGDFWLADVGQYAVEEVNVVPPARQAGANYGWRVFEGRRRNFRAESPRGPGTVVTPVHVFNHADGRCAVTGGVVYRGSVTALRGRYLFGDFCTGNLWSLPAGTGGGEATRLPFSAPQVTSFGVDAVGEVYVVSGGGALWAVTA